MDARKIAVIWGLIASFLVALYIRVSRVMLWGWWIDEFDPYIRYYLASYVAENGAGWWLFGGPVRFDGFWYPWGAEWDRILSPGTSLYGVFVYWALSPFGFSLWQSVVLAPAVFGSLSVFSMAYLVSRIGGRYAGLVAGVTVASTLSFVERSMAGWFDDEPISLFLIPLGLALLIDASRGRYWLGALGGLALGYVAWSWGAHIYIWNLVALAVLLWLAMSLFSMRLHDAKPVALTYITFYVAYIVMLAFVKRYFPSILTSSVNLIPVLALVGAVTALVVERVGVRITPSLVRRISIAVLVVGIGSLIISVALGLIGGRYLAVINPFERPPIVASVAEHSVTRFMDIYNRYALMIPLILVGAGVLASRLSFGNLVLLLYVATGTYAAAAMVRLLVLAAPALVAAFAVGLVALLKMAIEGVRSVRASEARISLALLAVLVMIGVGVSVDLAGKVDAYVRFQSPPQIAVSAGASLAEDWLDALMWISTRTEMGAPVAAWWDYGYWISVLGERPSLADNATFNSTQIAQIGKALVSPEDVAVRILRDELGAKYLVVFMPYTYLGSMQVPGDGPVTLNVTNHMFVHELPTAGDFIKSVWMARIAGFSDEYIFNNLLGQASLQLSQGGTFSFFVPLDLNVTLYKALFRKDRIFWIATNTELVRNNPFSVPQWLFEGVMTFTFRLRNNTFVQEPLVRELGGYEGPRIRDWDRELGFLSGVRYVEGWEPLLTAPQFKALRLVYVSKPYGWVLIYRIGPTA